ncbi:MAG: aldose epimerase [bacterium]
MNLEILENQPVLKIQAGNACALISPAHGARLLSWNIPGWDIIHWPANADWDRVPKVRGGDLVLFPFIARTYANSRIGSWIDESGVQRPAPMHGFAKDSPFRVVEALADSVTLRLDANETTAACYPFPFRLEVTHHIEPDALLTSFRVTNRGDQPMPWSAGHHYYFHIPALERPEWELSLACGQWGRQNFTDGSISFQSPSSCLAQLSDSDLKDRFHLQPDWSRLSLTNRTAGKHITFENASPSPLAWPCVTTWTEKPDSDFFCVEPWSALPNAIHHGMGLRSLAPGETDEIACRLRIALNSAKH